MSNIIDTTKKIWDKNWHNISDQDIRNTLNSSFTIKAYICLKSFIDDRDKKILELGCGTGRFCYLLAKDFALSEVVGIDISEESLLIADKLRNVLNQPTLRFKKDNLFSTRFSNCSFDVVFNEGVIEHFSLEEQPNYKDALKEMVRLTKPGGKILVAVPNWWYLPHTIYKKIVGKKYEYGYEKSFKAKELVSLFREFGLSGIELTAWYPAHSFYRLEKYSGVFQLIGDITDKVGNFIDTFMGNLFTKNFGFEILIKGVKAK